MSNKLALAVTVMVSMFLAMWPMAKVLAQNTCPGCSDPAKVVHPNGFGAHSYARWKPNVGLADSGGSVNFAMYMQHLTPPTDTSAGKAVVAIEGFDGEPVGMGGVTSLEFYVRLTPGAMPPVTFGNECTLTSPRFSVRWRIPGMPPDQFYNTTGCTMMAGSTVLMAPNGSQYLQRTFPVPTTAGAIIVSIAIIFDDAVQTFSHIDNISVTDANLGCTPCTWTRPADNGSN